VKGRDLADQCEADTAALPLCGEERHKDFVAMAEWNTGPAIGNGDDDMAVEVALR